MHWHGTLGLKGVIQFHQQTLLVNTARSNAKLVHYLVYAVCQKDQSKSIGAKAPHKMMAKLTPSYKEAEFSGERPCSRGLLRFRSFRLYSNFAFSDLDFPSLLL